MKLLKITILTVAAGLALFASSCSDDSDDPALRLSDSRCEFTYAGGEKAIAVETADKWSAVSGDTQWCTVAMSEGVLTVTASANETPQPRSTTVEVNGGGVTSFILVTQGVFSDRTVRLLPDLDVFRFDYGGSVLTLNVITDYEWDAGVDFGTSDPWIDVEIDREASLIRLTASRNPQDEVSPSASFAFRAEGDGNVVEKSMALSQGTKSEDPYYSLLGVWGLYSDKWIVIDAENTQVTHTDRVMTQGYLEEDVPGETYILRNLFGAGVGLDFMMHVSVDPVSGSLTLPTSECILELNGSYSYWSFTDFAYGHLTPDLTGLVSSDRNTISLSGIPAQHGFGMTMYWPDQADELILFFSETPYATGSVLELRRVAEDEEGFLPPKAGGTQGLAAMPDPASARPAGLGIYMPVR